MDKDFFDDLLDLELNKLPWNGKQDKGTFNDGKMVGFNAGAEWAYKQLVKNNGVLVDVSGSKLTTSDAFKATLEWIESDDVWIEDEQGNKVKGLKINGKNLKKYCEPYYR